MKKVFFIALLSIGAFITSFMYHKTQKADINYYQGHRLFERGKYDKAIGFYEKALDFNPSHLVALEELAYSYQWSKEYGRAIKTFQDYLSLNPENHRLKLSLSKTYSWIKEYEKAIAICEEIIEATDSLEAKKQLAEICIWNDQPDRAIGLLGGILKDFPEDKDTKLLLAKALQYSGRTREAIKLYRDLLRQKKEGK